MPDQVFNMGFLVLFFYAAIGIMIAEGLNRQSIRYLTKPLLMPLLLFFYLYNAASPSMWIVLALAMSFAGDVLLLWPKKPKFFMGGLGAFLLAHIFYIVYLILYPMSAVHLSISDVWVTVPLFIFGLAVFLLLKPGLGTMKLPVIVYILALLTVAFLSICIFKAGHSPSSLMILSGSLLFLLSDSILAWHNFRKPFVLAGVWFMLTYILAQLFLVMGFMN